MRIMSIAIAAAALAVTSTPAYAGIDNDVSAEFTLVDPSETFYFNVIKDGIVYDDVSSQLTLTLLGFAGNTASFGYSLFNDADYAATVTGFGFNVDPNFTGITIGAGPQTYAN